MVGSDWSLIVSVSWRVGPLESLLSPVSSSSSTSETVITTDWLAPPSSPHLSRSHPLLSSFFSPHPPPLSSSFLSPPSSFPSFPHPSLTGEVMPEVAAVSSRPILRGVLKLNLLVPSLPCACALLSLSSLPFPLPAPCPPTSLARSVYKPL